MKFAKNIVNYLMNDKIKSKMLTVLQNCTEIKKLKLELVRYSDDGKTTLGKLFVKKYLLFTQKIYYTCELSWKNNQNNISCIPSGDYYVKLHKNLKSRFHLKSLLVENVENRSGILIHSGNTIKDTKGCILVGNGVIDGKGITESRKALKELLELVGNETIRLSIKSI